MQRNPAWQISSDFPCLGQELEGLAPLVLLVAALVLLQPPNHGYRKTPCRKRMNFCDDVELVYIWFVLELNMLSWIFQVALAYTVLPFRDHAKNWSLRKMWQAQK